MTNTKVEINFFPIFVLILAFWLGYIVSAAIGRWFLLQEVDLVYRNCGWGGKLEGKRIVCFQEKDFILESLPVREISL